MDEHALEAVLAAEVLRRFPEIAREVSIEDANKASTVLFELAFWLQDQAHNGLDETIAERAVELSQWVYVQTQHENAGFRLFSMWHVGLIEELWHDENTQPLIPQLLPKAAILGNREYIERWVGKDEFQAVLKLLEEPRA